MLSLSVAFEFVLAVIVLSLIFFGITELLRAIFSSKVLAGTGLHRKKPLACNLCMSFWLSLAAAVYGIYVEGHARNPVVLLTMTAFALTMILLRRYAKAPLPE